MSIDHLRKRLKRATERCTKGRRSIARQRALILDLENRGRDTSLADDLLRTMVETQHQLEATERDLVDELKLLAPVEWHLNYAQKIEGRLSNKGNKLLNSLSFNDIALMQPFLERVSLKLRDRLQMANRILKTVHFPESGMISVVAVTGGGRNRTQIGLIGREGMTGISIGFGCARFPFHIEVEVAGQAQSIPTEKLTSLMDQSASIRATIGNYLYSLWLQFAHTAAANAHGTIEQRLARLLLLAHERLELDEIRLTHEQLAMMLAVRRSGVTMALQQFEARALITRERGNIAVLDPAGLTATARPLN